MYPLNSIGLTAPVSSIKVIYASKTMVSDANLSPGSNVFGTDQTEKFDAILSQASATQGIIVYVDVAFSARYIRPRSNTFIFCLDNCGFIQRSFSNCQFIANHTRSKSNYGNIINGVELGNRNITIQGGIINGNGWGNGAFNQDKYSTEVAADGQKVGGYNFLIAFAGVYNVLIKDCFLYNARTYFGFHTRCHSVTYQNVKYYVQDSAPYGNLDGLDFVGNCQNIKIIDCSAKCKDDCFAFAGQYGWQSNDINAVSYDAGNSSTSSWYKYASTGPVVDCEVRNFFFEDSYMGFRIMSSDGFVSRILISGLFGKIKQNLIGIIDNYLSRESGNVDYNPLWTPSGNNEGNVGLLTMENFQVEVPTPGSPVIYFGLKADEIVFKDWTHNGFTADNMILFGKYTNIRNLSFSGLKRRSTLGNNEALIVFNGGAKVQDLFLGNVNFDKTGAPANDSNIVRIDSGTIDNIQMSNITTRNTGAAINNVGGAVGGIQHNNFKGVMASAGAIGGTVAS